MPFCNYPEIDLEMVKVMKEAYDLVVARLKRKPQDPRTGKLAFLIVKLRKRV